MVLLVKILEFISIIKKLKINSKILIFFLLILGSPTIFANKKINENNFFESDETTLKKPFEDSKLAIRFGMAVGATDDGWLVIGGKGELSLYNCSLNIKYLGGGSLSDTYTGEQFEITIGMDFYNNKYYSIISRVGFLLNSMKRTEINSQPESFKTGNGFIWELELLLKFYYIYGGISFGYSYNNNEVLYNITENPKFEPRFMITLGLNFDFYHNSSNFIEISLN